MTVSPYYKARVENMCTRKRRYSDEMAARASAQNALLKDPQGPNLLWVYECPHCRGFHMSHRRGRSTAPFAVSRDDLYFQTAYERR